MTRTRGARERMLALYRSGTATEQELADAKAAYDEAATAEGVRAVVESLAPLTEQQRHILAVLLTPPPDTPRKPARKPVRRPQRRSRRGQCAGTRAGDAVTRGSATSSR